MMRVAATLGLMTLSLSAVAAEPRVEIIAHRGASHDAPENTIRSMKLAWKQNADAGELDIYLTKDGQLAVMHDKDTKRTTGVNKLIANTPLAELRKLDAGSWKGTEFAGEKIPTLTEMLATVPSGKKMYVEVKCGPEAVPELDRVLKASKLKPEQTPVICFKAEVVAAVKKARPDLPAYWLVSMVDKKKKTPPPTAEELIEKAKAIHADGLDLQAAPELNRTFANKVKAAGLRLFVWTVDDPAEARRLAESGVEGITTNRPEWLREQLAK